MKKIILIFISIILCTHIASSAVPKAGTSTDSDNFEKVGAAGAQFVKIAFGGRGTAMGGAFSSVVDDLSGAYWNPAGIADLDEATAYVSRVQWFGGYSHNFLSASAPINDDFTISGYWLNFTSGDIERTEVGNEDTKTFYSVNDFSFGLTLSGYLTEQFSFGVTAKMVNNAFSSVSADGYAFDIGTKYHTGLNGLNIAFTIQNLGSDQSYTGAGLNNSVPPDAGNFGGAGTEYQIPSYPFSLPLIFRMGASFEPVDVEGHKLTVAGDFITMSDTPEQFALGANYLWNEILSISGGYYFGNDQLSFSGGVGITYISGDFDGLIEYSFSPTQDIGLINRININLKFK
jgi:hypothetical protein